MGMCAEIIAIGPFSTRVAEFLDYRSDLYAATAEGSMISRRLFGISEGSSLSREFAELLGIKDPWDFNQHKIENEKINFAGLKNFGEVYDHYADDVVALEVLADSGFELHFRPEG
ncbi:hypothetical protein FHW83_000548 [Duganella sp. SG902]|uniref:hypothetical protein n=1 Tax=Duganella sp. SG902 TaxID=2587016 RepID=UPI00159DB196|nr:hypothetical protein [Duganella sp. SG902]NVM74788.1 hypothetical protein [Duganella sp. SG902]